MFLYLIWLRVTIAVTFTQLVFDAIKLNEAAIDRPPMAVQVPLPVTAGVTQQSASRSQPYAAAPASGTDVSHPHMAEPTIVQLQSLPATSKIQVTMETESKQHGGDRQPPQAKHEMTEIKQPQTEFTHV